MMGRNAHTKKNIGGKYVHVTRKPLHRAYSPTATPIESRPFTRGGGGVVAARISPNLRGDGSHSSPSGRPKITPFSPLRVSYIRLANRSGRGYANLIPWQGINLKLPLYTIRVCFFANSPSPPASLRFWLFRPEAENLLWWRAWEC